jgi:hypothetical protein
MRRFGAAAPPQSATSPQPRVQARGNWESAISTSLRGWGAVARYPRPNIAPAQLMTGGGSYVIATAGALCAPSARILFTVETV